MGKIAYLHPWSHHCETINNRLQIRISVVRKLLKCWGKNIEEYLYKDLKVGSVQFSCSVVSDSLRPHEPQHARPPCPSPTPGVYPNPCPLKPMSTELVMPSNHLILRRPLLLLPSVFPSIRVFSNECKVRCKL